MRLSQVTRLSVFSLTAAAGLSAADAPKPQDIEFFETKIRPVFARNCFACHTKTKVAGLAMDSREGLLKGGDTGPAIVPGEPDQSLLMKAIKHEDEKLAMPKGGKLKPQEIADIATWIRNGAAWPEPKVAPAAPSKGFEISKEMREFWSWKPLAKPEPPTVKNSAWAKTPIDRFILARLEEEGLKPVAPASRRTLIRRVTLNLTGLPPTADEVEAFVADKSPDAYAKLVDRLLASPAYGERWGRFWLDVARFGEDDTRGLAPGGKGHEPYQFAYLYRDWVIQAMNEDMPFDQFVKAQLAADSMDEKVRARMLPALGFLGQGPWYYDLTEPTMARADERHERVDTTTRAFLGLTVGCARCHDHKYDPIATQDYYSLAGIFNSSIYHEYPLAPKKVAEAYKKQEEKIKDLEKSLGEFQRTASGQLAEVLARRSAKYMMAVWKCEVPDKKTGEAAKPVELAAQDKLDLELLERWQRFLKKEPAFYPYLKDWQSMIAKKGSEKEAQKLADAFELLVMDVVAERKKVKEKNEKILAKGLPEEEVKSIPLPNGFKSFFDQHQLELKSLERERQNLYTDMFLYELTEETSNIPGRRFRPGLLVFSGYGLERQLSAEWNAHIASVKADIEKMRKAMPKQFPFVHGVKDDENPANIKIHLRGSPYSLGEEAPRQFPMVLASADAKPFSKGSGRAELADAIAAHPLTARVIVNRVWRQHFGTGIVETPSNFGVAGEKPSHPELLEYLASEFVANGRSIKKLHRMILLTSAYQLSSEYSAENAAKDSSNRLYWRANRQRMDAEQIRDSMLVASDTLDRKMFGPSEEFKDDFKRRTVYGRVSRFKLDTYLTLFDFPNPNITAEKRYITNVPLQRLFFLNSDFVYGQASKFVRRLQEEETDEKKIAKAYRLLFQRDATPAELKVGLDYLAAERARPADKESDKKNGEDDPKSLKPTDEESGEEGWQMSRPEVAEEKKKKQKADPWIQYARVLLSSSEFTFID
jgi:mono/diheme cytochrome c family protein/cytochrome c553